MVGEISLMDGIGRSANAITLDQTTMLWIDGQDFQEWLHSLPAFNQKCIKTPMPPFAPGQRTESCFSPLSICVGGSIRQMLEFASAYGQRQKAGSVTIPLRLTQSDMAALVRGSRERITGTLRSAKRLGYR